MIKVSKREAFDLRKLIGEKYIKKSYSKHPSYYMVESERNLAALEEYRKSKIIKNTNY